MPQHASSPTREGASTSRPSCSSYIGFQSVNVFSSRSPCWCTRHRTTSCLRTWQNTANLCLSLDTDTCLVQRTNTRFGDCSFAVAGPLPRLLEYGTVCQPSCESQILHSNNFDKHSKHICLVTDSCSAEWQCFSCTVYKLAYLLTYLPWQLTWLGQCTCQLPWRLARCASYRGV